MEVGRPINNDLRKLFDEMLTTVDLGDIADSLKDEVSYSVLVSLFYQKRNVTEDNKIGVYKMINKALEKSRTAINHFTRIESELVQKLPTVV